MSIAKALYAAAGYAACFLSALKFVAGKEKVTLPAEPASPAA